MKVVILCGGKGLRMNGISGGIPKALAEIHDRPMLWHIMQLYSKYGHRDFILPLGYKGDQIKKYFMNQSWKDNDFVLHLRKKQLELLELSPDWTITFVDTGLDTMTGARVKQIEKYVQDDTFLLTYGDGLANIDLDALLQFHKQKGKVMTVTGIRVQSQYGHLLVDDGIATRFEEKQKLEGIINGGFFVCNHEVFRYFSEDPDCILEEEPLRKIVNDGELAVYEHPGFWIGVDTPKDLKDANEKWKEFDPQIDP